MARKPTGLVTGMASVYAITSGEDREIWSKIFKDVVNHPESNFSAKEIANDVLDDECD